MKAYNSFDEVGNDLRILKLKAKIHEEEIKLNAEHLKEDLSPISLMSGLVAQVARKAFVKKVVSKFLGRSR